MKPLKLEFQGLHSYRDPVVIEFSRLADAGFFGIFGPTGAGKSTILDAITFALFGRIDRSSSLADSLSSGAKALWAKFRFALGNEVYEVYRKLERRRSGLVSADFYLARSGERLPLEGIRKLDRAVEELLGLSFEQFVTAVFLPQGKFARFLRLKPAERRMLLAEIFRLERFGEPLYRAVREARGRLEAEHEALFAELAPLEPFTEGSLKEAEEEFFSLQDHVQRLQQELMEFEERRREAEEFLRLTEETETLGVRFAELVERTWSPEVQGKLEERLRLADRAQEVAAAAEARERRSQALEEKRGELSSYEVALQEHRRRRAFFAEEARKKLESLGKQETRLRELKGEISGLIPERVEALREREKRLVAERAHVGPTEAPPFPPEELVGLEELLEHVKVLLMRRGEIGRRMRELEGEIAAVEVRHVELQRTLKAREAELMERERELSERERTLEELRREIFSAELARELEDGVPCPVCGATEHPSPARAPEDIDLAAEEGAFSRLRDEVRALREAAAVVRTEVRLQEELLGTKREKLASLREELRRLERELGALREKIPKPVASLTWDDLAEKLPHWDAYVKQEELERDLAETRRELVHLENIWKRVVEGLGEIYQPLDLKLLERYRRLIDSRLKRLQEERRVLEVNLEELERKEAELAEMVSGLRGQVEELSRGLAEAEERLALLLSETEIPPEDAKAFALTRAERELIEEALELGRRIGAYRARLASFSVGSVDEAEEVIRTYDERRTEYEILQQKLGEVQEKLRSLREKLSRKQELTERVRELEAKLRSHRELEALLRGKAFLEYLVGSQFERILSRASHYTVQLSQGRYVLQGEGTELEVIDYRNGGVARPPHTLSGGETFLVSLSLALALSEAIQLGRRGGAPPIEFFFIDEGFGNLDEESVRVVLELLYRLVDEGLRVGVITHVEALRRGIPYKLLVYPPDEERGSRVELVIGE